MEERNLLHHNRSFDYKTPERLVGNLPTGKRSAPAVVQSGVATP